MTRSDFISGIMIFTDCYRDCWWTKHRVYADIALNIFYGGLDTQIKSYASVYGSSYDEAMLHTRAYLSRRLGSHEARGHS
jgi:hypothetical protein